VSTSSQSGFAIGLLGAGSGESIGGAVGFGGGKSKSKTETSTKSITLIIKFNKDQIVSDFKSRASSF
jgi:hypothetical protein